MQNTSEILADILLDLKVLLQKEMQLIRLNIKEDVKELSANTRAFMVAVFFLCLGVVFFTVSAANWLSETWKMPLWQSHLVVAIGLTLVGGILGFGSYIKFKKEAVKMSLPGLTLRRNPDAR